VQCTRLTPQLLQAVARLPRLADLNLAQFDLAAASRCENMLNWQLLYTLAAMTSLTALDLSHVMIQEQQARASRGPRLRAREGPPGWPRPHAAAGADARTCVSLICVQAAPLKR